MKQHEKESFLKGVLNELGMGFGLALIKKILGDIEQPAADKVAAIIPHLEAMTPHELVTVISVADGIRAGKETPSCPQGQVWNGTRCVDDVG